MLSQIAADFSARKINIGRQGLTALAGSSPAKQF
jgi:hypothetical protein